jgi:tripartite-type tricarboxylate transporter receptor subunit TctC
MRRLVLLCLTAALLVSEAHAQTFPTAPFRIFVPFAAGGPTDVVARILAELLTARWGGKSVVIENRPGAGTIVATAAVAKAPPDGHTVLIGTNSLLINPAIDLKLPYDTYRDLLGVSMIATQPVALVANKAFAANTVPEVVAEAKKAASPLNFASPDPRGVGHLAGEMLKNVATIAETYPGFDVIAFNAMIAPAATPKAILNQLSADIRAVVGSPEFIAKTRHLGIFPGGNSPEELDAWMRRETARWAEIAKAAGIKAE